MSEPAIIFFLLIIIVLLSGIVLYQRFLFGNGIQTELHKISGKLKEITDTNSDEMIMVFTENKELMELAAQINRLLENHLKVKADYRHAEISSRKMLSNISHDIKTPMTVILGYLEIMRINGTPTNEMLEKIDQKAKNVMELINQFFTLAKLESGDMDMALSKIDVCEICRESVLDFYDILTSDDFEVTIDVPKTAVYIYGNENAVQRILSNLISNVIRYGSDGKYLGVSLRTNENTVYIDVSDKGKGIDKHFANNVFDRLFTMEDSRNRNIQGNGLGLTIARDLALQLGGDITLDSTPYVKTTFTLMLKKMSY
ncbi:MAG: sensor histidine kinase [Lachnospiraceae bacterium]|nr:sensor histidine kinase [Lachnospiraceae bacterium]